MLKKIKVISVEDNESHRKMIKEFLRNNNDIELVKEFVSAESLLKYLNKNEGKSIDVILLDLSLPGSIQGIEAIPKILSIDKNINIVVLTAVEDDLQVLKALREGANGYVLKDNTQDELIETIKIVSVGYIRINKDLSLREPSEGKLKLELSDRQIKILHLLALGKSQKEISGELCVSNEAIKAQCKSIKKKFGASNLVEATIKAVKLGIIDPKI